MFKKTPFRRGIMPIGRRSLMQGAGALSVAAGAKLATARPALAQSDDERMAAARRWMETEFSPSTLSIDEQMEEMAFLIQASEPFRGMDINVVSETITTHEYEAGTMAQAFREITGINLTHDLIQEGDVIERLQTQMQSGRNVYDGYVNDSDLIGTHFRYGHAIPLSDFITGEGADVTFPGLDLDDFIGISFTTGPDGKVYQLPDQQFANLYWFRYDWFNREDLQAQFRERYGYELGVPVNWKAYQDIADFFTNHVQEIDGERVYGHMDYGRRDPSLGWRFTDAWLSMAGCGLCPAEVHRLAAAIRPAGSPGHELFRGRAGAGSGQYRPADLLVHRLHCQPDPTGPAGG